MATCIWNLHQLLLLIQQSTFRIPIHHSSIQWAMMNLALYHMDCFHLAPVSSQ